MGGGEGLWEEPGVQGQPWEGQWDPAFPSLLCCCIRRTVFSSPWCQLWLSQPGLADIMNLGLGRAWTGKATPKRRLHNRREGRPFREEPPAVLELVWW